MNTDKKSESTAKLQRSSVTGVGEVPRDIREKQDRIIEICERRGFAMDAPISDLQYGAPTAQELKAYIYPDFVASIDSFLASFDNH